jgi:hypothetical protein
LCAEYGKAAPESKRSFGHDSVAADGEPAIVPGDSAKSPPPRFVSDQVEDLEMPPPAKRRKHPGLSAAGIPRIRAWIDQGAVRPETEKVSQKSANAD